MAYKYKNGKRAVLLTSINLASSEFDVVSDYTNEIARQAEESIKGNLDTFISFQSLK